MMDVLRIGLTVAFASRAISECIWASSADPTWFNETVIRGVSKQNDGSATSRISSLLMAALWVGAIWLLWTR